MIEIKIYLKNHLHTTICNLNNDLGNEERDTLIDIVESELEELETMERMDSDLDFEDKEELNKFVRKLIHLNKIFNGRLEINYVYDRVEELNVEEIK